MPEEVWYGGISMKIEGLGANRKVSLDQRLILQLLCSAASLPHSELLCAPVVSQSSLEMLPSRCGLQEADEHVLHQFAQSDPLVS